MKRTISFVMVIVMAFVSTFGFSFNAVNDEHRITDEANYREVKDFCEKKASQIDQHDDIRELFAANPGLEALLHSKGTLNSLYHLLESGEYRGDEMDIWVLINYIESGYRVTSIADLRDANINLVTICGNTIPGKRYLQCTDLESYNCHSYAWYYGGSFNPSDRMHIQDPRGYFSSSNGSCYTARFEQVPLSRLNRNNVRVGDIVVYWAYKDEAQVTGGNPAHSGIVVRFSGSSIIIRSKEGGSGISECAIQNSSYYLAIDGGNAGMPRMLSVYRPSHQINSSWVANQNYKYKNDSYHYVACIYCGRGKTSNVAVEFHTFVGSGSLSRCSKCGYRRQQQNSLPDIEFEYGHEHEHNHVHEHNHP